MFSTGLFILTKPLKQVRKNITLYLSEINRLVSETAYIHIQPASDRESLKLGKFNLRQTPFSLEIRNIVKEFYSRSSDQCGQDLNVRILLGHVTNSTNNIRRYELKRPCDVIVIDELIKEESQSDLRESIERLFCVQKNFVLESFNFEGHDDDGNAGTSEQEVKYK